MSAVRTERFGSFLKADLDPSVAANLVFKVKLQNSGTKKASHQSRPTPLSLFASISGVKNMMSSRAGGVRRRVFFYLHCGEAFLN